MKVVRGIDFRCDLCGKFRTVGVTEDDPIDTNYVCVHCIVKAEHILAVELLGLEIKLRTDLAEKVDKME